MPELGFQERTSSRPAIRPRNASPDSVIFTLESNFSLFSSASASVDRCSFASDAHDHDSLASETSLNLAGHDGDFSHNESSSGPDPDPDPNKYAVHNKHSGFSRKREKAKVQKEDCDADIEDGNQLLDSARNSFSVALKECQDRRSRTEASLKTDWRRPASLDLNNAASSPRLGTLKKSLISSRRSGTFASPGTPNYRQTSVAMQKGWSSERVPLHTNASRKQASSALLPFNNGRTLPSKWEDAERWILSPVSGDGTVRTALPQPLRRPKSKSGPLGPPGIAYHSLYSPAIPMFEGQNAGNFMASSPFSAGVVAADGLAVNSIGHSGLFPTWVEPCMARSISVHGCTEMQNQSSLCSAQDEKFDAVMDAASNISCAVSRRDMATQMSPEGSPCSSPTTRPSFSASTPSTLPIMEVQSVSSSKMEIRDVQVDERVTMTRWSKKHKARFPGKGSENADNRKKKETNAQSSSWDTSETAKSISKAKREEAKITAWEDLQKAKTEAAIRKLEMKLEKKRASSMDRIMNKLRSAQKKAQEMRRSVLANQAHQVTRTSHKAISFRQMGPLSGCLTCNAL
ncbi:Remorin [Quillaja saponaria]|uniref:Remorin n=1 Tax=Quillaja saponaria TaxID=32244 RepID=A0AAD7M0R1_QUISA|nr:Remorin [Quillaja saponaria]